MKANLIFIALLVGSSATAQASTIVFSNLQTGDARQCGCAIEWGRQLGTQPGDPLESLSAGDAFTVLSGTDFTLDSIELAAGIISGDNRLSISLNSDKNGMPGSILESFELDNQMGRFGKDHPPLVAESVFHPVLMAGVTYWVLATTTDPLAEAGWFANNTLDTGPIFTRDSYFYAFDPSCCVRTDLRDAFSVLGIPVHAIPEASTAGTAAVGLAFIIAGLIPRRSAG
ncbi:MAG: hypothetical protein LAO55_17485 [Acidobacteriia bacterium]|nr:hypothetical protein [Terriglobia bacterium]